MGTAFFRPGGSGLSVFLNAGDPPLGVLPELVAILDEARVDCLELAVPFLGSVSDGPVIRASAATAVRRGVTLASTLRTINEIRPFLVHTRIAVLMDWASTRQHQSIPSALAEVADSEVDAVLLHAVPPVEYQPYIEAATDLGVSVVSTCFATSSEATLRRAAESSSAYIYIVGNRGRTGAASCDFDAVSDALAALRRITPGCETAVGFGIRNSQDVAEVRARGANSAIVGTPLVAEMVAAQERGADLALTLRAFLHHLLATGT